MAASGDDPTQATGRGVPAPRNHARALTTAYASNTRPARPAGSGAPPDYGWCPAINRLIASDYAFLPVAYAADGCLFRGIDCGAADAIARGRFGISESEHPLSALERDLEVLLVSGDVSDAVSVARLWEAGRDACVIAIRARYVAAQSAARRAAVLGFAEPGVVFRYPFLAGPIPAAALGCVFVREDAFAPARGAAETGRTQGPGYRGPTPIVMLPAHCNERRDCETQIAGELGRRGLAPAAVVPGGAVPGRHASA